MWAPSRNNRSRSRRRRDNIASGRRRRRSLKQEVEDDERENNNKELERLSSATGSCERAATDESRAAAGAECRLPRATTSGGHANRKSEATTRRRKRRTRLSEGHFLLRLQAATSAESCGDHRLEALSYRLISGFREQRDGCCMELSVGCILSCSSSAARRKRLEFRATVQAERSDSSPLFYLLDIQSGDVSQEDACSRKRQLKLKIESEGDDRLKICRQDNELQEVGGAKVTRCFRFCELPPCGWRKLQAHNSCSPNGEPKISLHVHRSTRRPPRSSRQQVAQVVDPDEKQCSSSTMELASCICLTHLHLTRATSSAAIAKRPAQKTLVRGQQVSEDRCSMCCSFDGSPLTSGHQYATFRPSSSSSSSSSSASIQSTASSSTSSCSQTTTRTGTSSSSGDSTLSLCRRRPLCLTVNRLLRRRRRRSSPESRSSTARSFRGVATSDSTSVSSDCLRDSGTKLIRGNFRSTTLSSSSNSVPQSCGLSTNSLSCSSLSASVISSDPLRVCCSEVVATRRRRKQREGCGDCQRRSRSGAKRKGKFVHPTGEIQKPAERQRRCLARDVSVQVGGSDPNLNTGPDPNLNQEPEAEVAAASTADCSQANAFLAEQQLNLIPPRCPHCSGDISATSATGNDAIQQEGRSIVEQSTIAKLLSDKTDDKNWSPPIRVQAAEVEKPEAAATLGKRASEGGHAEGEPNVLKATKSLLSPMDFVWRGLSESRALSCTEASLSGDSSSIVAQLAQAARSKSLCTESVQPSAQLGAGGKRRPEAWAAARASQMAVDAARLPKRAILGLGGQVGRLISHLKSLSASNPAMGLPEDTPPDERSPRFAWRRASSQRVRRQPPPRDSATPGSGGRSRQPAPLEQLVRTHKLNRFASISTTALGQAPAAAESPLPRAEEPPEVASELHYSRDGIYLGPGGICSYEEVCKRQQLKQRKRPVAWRRSVAAPWRPEPRLSVAPAQSPSGALPPAKGSVSRQAPGAAKREATSAQSDTYGFVASDQVGGNGQLAAPISASREQLSSSWEKSTHQQNNLATSAIMNSFRSQQQEQIKSKFLRDQATGRQQQAKELASDRTENCDRNKISLETSDLEEKQMEGQRLPVGQRPEEDQAAGRFVPGGQRPDRQLSASIRTRERSRRPAAEGAGSRCKLTASESSQPAAQPSHFLSKEARSNSLSGLFQGNRLVELSKSSMDLNLTADHCPLNESHSLARETTLYLNELSARYSGSSHELAPPIGKSSSSSGGDHWFRRLSNKGTQSATSEGQFAAGSGSSHQMNEPSGESASKTVDSQQELNRKQKLADPSEPVELYGANLASICVHCQLIADLANHPSSMYLSQLLSSVRQPPSSSQVTSGEQLPSERRRPTTPPIRPSVVLTVCTSRGTEDRELELEPQEAEVAAGGDSRQVIAVDGQLATDGRQLIGAGGQLQAKSRSASRRRRRSSRRRRRPSPVQKSTSSASLISPSTSKRHLQKGCCSPAASESGRLTGAAQSSASGSSSNSEQETSTPTTGPSDSDELEAGGAAAEAGEQQIMIGNDVDADDDDKVSDELANDPAEEQLGDIDALESADDGDDDDEQDQEDRSYGCSVDYNSDLASSSQSLASCDDFQAKVKPKRKSERPTIKAPAQAKQKSTKKVLNDNKRRQAAEEQKEDKNLLSVQPQASKQNRSASLDAPYLLKVPQRPELEEDESYPGNASDDGGREQSEGASKSNRSRSVDISLPTRPGESYSVMLQAAAEQMRQANEAREARAKREAAEAALNRMLVCQQKKFIQGEIKVACANGETRALKLFVDWQDDCVNGEHLWIYAGSSSDACYVGENECLKHGPRLCCSACKITAHTGCISILIDKIKFICKHTFKDLTVNNPRHIKEQHNVIYHHWVHKRTHCGRCKQCTKTFGNTKLPFSSKEIQAITCSWCKVSYHNKENCYTLSVLTEPCSLGAHRESIIPPTWILKLPSGNNNTLQQQKADPVVENQYQGHEVNEVLQLDKLIDISMTSHSHAFKPVGDDEKDNNENIISRQQQQNNSNLIAISNKTFNQQPQHLNYGSNTTLMTDTSGYMSADGLNAQALASSQGNQNQANKIVMTNDNNNQERIKPSSQNHGQNKNPMDCSEIIIDPSALQASDLSILNQAQNQLQTKSERHPQDILANSQYQQHQLKQYYRQLDANHNSEQFKPSEAYNESDSSMFIDLQLMQQQQQQYQNPSIQSSEGLYHNFKIIPQSIQGIPNAGSKPVLVFVNPRSGGNQGAKMMQKFNWLLNPRQVFDLIQSGGPRAALELYKDVPNLRILTIGGDGTASWILSYLDEVGISNRIPVAVLPLGTGNDLARALGWGGGYADEPIAKILTQVRDGEVVQLDRWNLQVERNFEVAPCSPNEFSSNSAIAMEISPPSISSSPSYFGSLSQSNTNTASTISIIDQTNCDSNMIQASTNTISAFNAPVDEAGSDRLPMDVINNYFSFGVDAHIALEFHTAREAHPERFNSRLRNKMFYGQAGGKDLLKRKWKDLSNFVTLYCDGQDLTSRLKELKVHSVLFLNISSYGGGTRPWPTTATSFAKPRTDDGLIEVIGLTTYQLPLLQAGGHGTCIAQCRSARIITSRTIPMQVDGEPCKLLPSIINISFKNRVCMLAKSKSSSKSANMTSINVQKAN